MDRIRAFNINAPALEYLIWIGAGAKEQAQQGGGRMSMVDTKVSSQYR